MLKIKNVIKFFVFAVVFKGGLSSNISLSNISIRVNYNGSSVKRCPSNNRVLTLGSYLNNGNSLQSTHTCAWCLLAQLRSFASQAAKFNVYGTSKVEGSIQRINTSCDYYCALTYLKIIFLISNLVVVGKYD